MLDALQVFNHHWEEEKKNVSSPANQDIIKKEERDKDRMI